MKWGSIRYKQANDTYLYSAEIKNRIKGALRCGAGTGPAARCNHETPCCLYEDSKFSYVSCTNVTSKPSKSCYFSYNNTEIIYIGLHTLSGIFFRQEGHPACKKTEWWGAGMVICLEPGADLHMAQLMPLPLTVSCSSKNQIGFTCLVPAQPGSPGQRAVKRLRVCVRVYCRTISTTSHGSSEKTLSIFTGSFRPSGRYSPRSRDLWSTRILGSRSN